MTKIKKIALITTLAVIVILVVIFTNFSQEKKVVEPVQVEITSSVPSQGASRVSVFDPIKIVFNKPVDAQTITITSDPSETWKISQINKTSIKVTHDIYLRVATGYVLTIFQNNNQVGTLTFETAHNQNDPRQLQTLQSEVTRDYPLASSTPYETPDYRVVYNSPLALEIQLIGAIDGELAILQVKTWVKSNGIDAETHKYTVVKASPTP